MIKRYDGIVTSHMTRQYGLGSRPPGLMIPEVVFVPDLTDPLIFAASYMQNLFMDRITPKPLKVLLYWRVVVFLLGFFAEQPHNFGGSFHRIRWQSFS